MLACHASMSSDVEIYKGTGVCMTTSEPSICIEVLDSTPPPQTPRCNAGEAHAVHGHVTVWVMTRRVSCDWRDVEGCFWHGGSCLTEDCEVSGIAPTFVDCPSPEHASIHARMSCLHITDVIDVAKHGSSYRRRQSECYNSTPDDVDS